MQTRLTHPEHGSAHAFNETELKDLLKRGFIPDEKAPVQGQTAVVVELPRKVGRPRKQ